MKNLKTYLEALQTLNLLYQYCLIILVMKTVHSDEYNAQSQDSERTLFCPDLYVLTNDEHWTMTLETHKYAAAAGSFCFATTENWRTTRHMQLDHRAVCTTIIVPQ